MHYRDMKANQRAVQKAIGQIRAAARSCPFHHSSQPSVKVPNREENSTLHDTESNSTQSTAYEFFNIQDHAAAQSCRSLLGDVVAFVVKHRIGRDACNELFSILTSHGVKGFPKDCRSAKNSMRKVDIVVMGAGSYFHFGLEKEVIRNVGLLSPSDSPVRLQFNIDGLPLHNSSPVAFWPILCRAFVGSSSTRVFPIGVFCGKSKPVSVDMYLGKFLEELKATLQNGIYINNVRRVVVIHSFVCDAPARQYVKKVKAHSGYYGCERCEICGERSLGGGGGIKFVKIGDKKRTDESFRAQRYSSHQKPNEVSPLVQLPLDLIADFPLDYMHLVLLGVVKRLLRLWLGTTDFHVTKYSCNFRLLARTSSPLISERVRVCYECVPCEFQRRPRQMDENKFFKAKEYRTLLLYTFPYVFQGLFTNNPRVYTHFLLLVVSFRIMLSQKPSQTFVQYVRELLQRFVQDLQGLYGSMHMTYSVHNLLHVADDYERFGLLDNVSAFLFESYMQTLKNYVGRGGQELQQAVKRRHEETLLDICPAAKVRDVALKKEHQSGPLGDFVNSPVEAQYSWVELKGKRFSLNERDQYICVENQFYRIANFILIDGKLYTLVNKFENVDNFFDFPCESKRVGIVVCKKLSQKFNAIDLGKAEKCVAFQMKDNELYVAKLLHECVED